MPEGSSSSGAQVGSEASGGEQEGTFQKGVPVTLLSHCWSLHPLRFLLASCFQNLPLGGRSR